MKSAAILVLVALTIGHPTVVSAGSASANLTPIGVWATDDGESRIQIEECGNELCGKIIWLKDPFEKNGTDAVDSENPDPRLRTRKLIGLTILGGFIPDRRDPNLLGNGWIYDPDSGKTYSSNLRLDSPESLRVRGYIGLPIFGASRIWSRVK